MKIIVIGSGLLGISTAYYLAQHGHQVSVIERREGVAMETSFANATLLTPSLSAPLITVGQIMEVITSLFSKHPALRISVAALPELISWGIKTLRYLGKDKFKQGLIANFRMSEYNLASLQTLQTELPQLDYDHETAGSLMFFRKQKSFEAMLRHSGLFAEFGIQHESLNARAIIKREPALADVAGQFAGGIYQVIDEHGDPYKFCQCLEQQCRSLGVSFSFNTSVTRLQHNSGKLDGIETNAGIMQADAYVLATGSPTAELTANTALPVPVYPVKGYSISLDMSGVDLKPKIPLLDGEKHVALVPLANRLRVAGFAELAGFDSTLYEDRIQTLKHSVKQVFPVQSPQLLTGDLNPWSGLRPLSCDGVPLVGPTELKNVYLNTGHGALGWTMAAASGKLLADLITGGKADIDLTPYSPLRFA